MRLAQKRRRRVASVLEKWSSKTSLPQKIVSRKKTGNFLFFLEENEASQGYSPSFIYSWFILLHLLYQNPKLIFFSLYVNQHFRLDFSVSFFLYSSLTSRSQVVIKKSSYDNVFLFQMIKFSLKWLHYALNSHFDWKMTSFDNFWWRHESKTQIREQMIGPVKFMFSNVADRPTV